MNSKVKNLLENIGWSDADTILSEKMDRNMYTVKSIDDCFFAEAYLQLTKHQEESTVELENASVLQI